MFCCLLTLSLGTSTPTLFFSQYQEGASNDRFLQIYNPTGATISLDGYALASTSNAVPTPGVHERRPWLAGLLLVPLY